MRRPIGIIAILLLILSAGTGIWYATDAVPPLSDTQTAAAENATPLTQTRFLLHLHDTVNANYWQSLSQERLADLIARGVQRFATATPSGTPDNRDALEDYLSNTFTQYAPQQRTDIAERAAALVLQSLQPQGRSQLYTKQDRKQLEKRVKNNTQSETPQEQLDVEDDADPETVEKQYEEKKQQVQESTSTPPEEKEEQVRELAQAKETLTDTKKRTRYEQAGVRPTVFRSRISDDIVYLSIEKFSIATLQEFVEEAQAVNMDPQPHALILDLRGNVGGAFDAMPQFLGPFIGPNRTAFQLQQQGEQEPITTETGWLNALVPYKQVVVLVDGDTQSTAELVASVLKNYNVGTIVGETTRGWGTIERTFPLEPRISSTTKHYAFLVHSLTLKGNGQPIQGNGVQPDVSLSSDNWQDTLHTYIPSRSLVDAVADILEQRPLPE